MPKHERSALLSPTMTRIGLLLAVPMAVIIGIKAIAWAAVAKSWNSGEVLKAADLNAALVALDGRIAALESGIKQSTMTITATVSGASGGTSSAACPTDFTLTTVSLTKVQLTTSGTSGWPMGTYGCSIQDGILVANLSNYAMGTPSTLISCQGFCVK